MPREPINARKAYDHGWSDYCANKPSAVIPRTEKETYANYYRAGRIAARLGVAEEQGYQCTRSTLGMVTDMIPTIVIENALAMLTPEHDPIVTEKDDRLLIDCDTCIVRVLADDDARAPRIEVIPMPREGQLTQNIPVIIQGTANVKALRQACDWLLAKEVTREMTNAQRSGPHEGRAEQAVKVAGPPPKIRGC